MRHIAIGALRALVDNGYDGNVSAAAGSWGLEQSHLCRVLKGERSLKPSAIRRIAKKEHVHAATLIEAGPGPAHLKVLPTDANGTRFQYDVSDPARMLMQLQNWFAEVPNKAGMKTGVVKAVMRALFDNSFDEVHTATSEWRAVMDHMDGWTVSIAQERRRSRI